jgi:single-strand DNA-binding protein
MSLNQCNFIGNLGADPETRTFGNGNKVTNLRLAVSEKWKDRDSGERKEKTEWVSVAIFGPLADVAANYLRKGSKVFVSGKFTTRKWQDQSGQDRYSTEIVLQGPQAVLQMLDGKRDDGMAREPDLGQDQRTPEGYPADDEIPF